MLIRRRRIKLHIEHRSSRRVTAANEGITPAGSEPFSPACAPASAAHADSSQLPRSLPLSSGVLPMHLALATKPNVEAAGRSWLLSLLVKALRRLGFVILLGLLLPGWRAALSQLAVVDGIKTVAGDGFGNGIYGSGGFAGDSGPATSAELNMPFGVAFDAAGNFYIADSTNNRIRKVTLATGVITTVAGNGTAYTYAGDGGPATSAALNSPDGVALDSAGNIYIADSGNSVIRKVTVATGIITTAAGTGVKGFSGDTGPATSAQLSTPYGIALDSAGNLYIADSGNGRVRKVTASTGIITTVAGNVPAYYPGTMTQMPAGDGGAATSSSILEPFGLAFDPSGNLYISDTAAAQIRKVSASTGIITTYAGTNTNGGLGGSTGDGGPATSALIDNAGIALDKAGNLYIADWLNNHVREVFAASGIIQTIAGNGAGGGVVGGTGTANYQGDGGPATQAELDRPYGVAVGPDGSIYVADTRNEAIRGISTSLPLPGNVSSVSFPTTPVQSSRPVQTLFLETTTAETISSISVPRSVGGAQEFSVGAVTGCAVDGVTSNAAGTVCTGPVTFSPAYPGLLATVADGDERRADQCRPGWPGHRSAGRVDAGGGCDRHRQRNAWSGRRRRCCQWCADLPGSGGPRRQCRECLLRRCSENPKARCGYRKRHVDRRRPGRERGLHPRRNDRCRCADLYRERHRTGCCGRRLLRRQLHGAKSRCRDRQARDHRRHGLRRLYGGRWTGDVCDVSADLWHRARRLRERIHLGRVQSRHSQSNSGQRCCDDDRGQRNEWL
jgi:sugar lactone lactonase YvrE